MSSSIPDDQIPKGFQYPKPRPPKIVPRVTPSEALPVSITQKIIHHILESKKVAKTKIGGVPSARKLLERTESIFDSVARLGGLTEDNLREINELNEEEIQLQDRLDELTEKGTKFENIAKARETCREVLKVAGQALNELNELTESLRITESRLDTFEEVLEQIEMPTFSQRHTGEVLNFSGLLDKGLVALHHLDDPAIAAIPGSVTHTLLKERAAYGAAALAFAVSEWEDEAIASIRLQRQALIKAYRSPSATETTKRECALLLSALERHLDALEQALFKAAHNTALYPGLEEKLQHAARQIEKERLTLSNTLKKEPVPTQEHYLPYGNEEWRQLAARHLPPPKSPKEDHSWSLFHPELWSERTKRGVSALFSVMQLGQQAIELAQVITRRGGSATGEHSPAAYKPQTPTAPQKNVVLMPSPLSQAPLSPEISPELLQEQREIHSLRSLQSFVEGPGLVYGTDALTNNHPIDDKIIQHILGSYFGKDTDLEGFPSTRMVGHVLALISIKIESLRNNPLCLPEDKSEFCSMIFGIDEKDVPLELFSKLAEQFKTAEEIGKAFNDPDPGRFVEVFTHHLDGLESGDSFFFSGVLTHRTASHAMVYEVIKQSNGLFSFRIYNRGEGGENHAMAIVEGKVNNLPFTEVVDITKENLTKLPFLYGLRQIKEVLPPRLTDWHPSDLYHNLVPSLKGKASGRFYSGNHLMEMLRVGHCSYLSLTALMNYHLGDTPAYARWEIEMELKTLWDYFRERGPSFLSLNEQSRRLLAEGLVQFSRNVVKARDKGLVTDHEAVWIDGKLTIIRNALELASTEHQKVVSATAPLVSIQPDEYLSQVLSLTAPNQPKGDYDVQKTIHPLISRADWEYAPERFVDDLQALVDEVNSIGTLNSATTRIGIATFISKVPLVGNVFWEKLGPAEAQKAMSLLQELGINYLFAEMDAKKDLGNQDKLFAENAIPAIKMLTLADAIAAHFAQQWGYKFPNMMMWTMEAVVEGTMTASTVAHPLIEDERRQLRDYWQRAVPLSERDEKTISFFGFELGASRYGSSSSIEIEFLREFNLDRFAPQDKKMDEKYEWGDIEFAKEWTKRPEIKVKLPLEIALQDPLVQALMLLSREHEGKDYSLPLPFFALRDLSLAVYYLNYNRKEPDTLAVNLKKRLFNGFRCIHDKENNQASLSGGHNSMTYQEQNLASYEYRNRKVWDHLDNLRATQGKRYPFPPYLEFYMSKRNLFYLGRDRIPPQNRMIVEQVKTYDKRQLVPRTTPPEITDALPFFDTQELLSLSSIEDQQIQATFAHYSKHPQLFNEEKYRAMFIYLMIENGLFTQELIKSPEHAIHFASTLAKFCNQQRVAHQAMGNTELMLYFMEITQKFDAHVKYAAQKHLQSFPEGYRSPFFDGRNLLKQVSANPSVSSVDRSTAQRVLMRIALNESPFTEASAIDLLQGAFFFDIHGFPADSLDHHGDPTDSCWNPAVKNEMLNALSDRHGALKQLLEDAAARNRILNGAAQLYYPFLQDVSWNPAPSFPYFKDATGNFELDLQKGVIYFKGQESRPFPESRRGHPVVQALLKEEPGILISGHPIGPVYFNDRHGNHYLLERDWAQSVDVLYRSKFGSTWYRSYDSKILADQIFSKQLLDKSTVWIEVPPSRQTSPLEGQRPQSYPQQQPPPHRLKAYIADSTTNTLKYRMELTEDTATGTYTMKEVHRLGDDQTDTGEVLVDVFGNDSPYRFLSRIDELSNVLVWQDKESNTPTQIELPRYGLSFHFEMMDGAYIPVSDNFHGYRLAKHQYVPQLGDITTYLVLEDDRGNTYALLPKEEMVGLKTTLVTETKVDTSTRMERDIDEFGRPVTVGVEPKEKYLLQRIPGDGSKITPDSREARFLLARMFLWERDYSTALDYLRGYESQLSPFSSEEWKELKTIILMEWRNKDQTPEASAVRLYVNFLMNRNIADFHEGVSLYSEYSFEEAKKILNDDMRTYTEQRGLIGTLALRKDEEAFLGLGTRESYAPQALASEIAKAPFDRAQPTVDFIFEIINGKLIIPKMDMEWFRDQVIKSTRGQTVSIISLAQQGSMAAYNPSFSGTIHPSVLRTPIAHYFKDLYMIAQKGKYDGDAIHALKNISGIDLPPDSDPAWVKKNLFQVFELLSDRQMRIEEYVLGTDVNNNLLKLVSGQFGEDLVNSVLAGILKAVLEHPEKFSPIDDVVLNPKDSADYSIYKFFDDHPIIQTAAALWSKPPEETKPAQTVFIRKDAPPIATSNVRAPTPGPAHKTSTRLPDDKPLQFVGVENSERFFEWVPATTEAKGKAELTTNELSGVFAVKTGDPSIDRGFEEMKTQFQAYKSKRMRSLGQYRLRSAASLNNMKNELLAKHNRLNDLGNEQESFLLHLANKPYDIPALQAERDARITGRLDKPLSTKELFHLFRTRDKEKIAQRNPALSPQEIESVYQQIKELLETMREMQHQARILSIIGVIEKKPGPQEMEVLVKELARLANANVQYNAAEHPDYLVLEVEEGYIFRKDQIDNLDIMSRFKAREGSPLENGAVLEAIPGSGKSSVLSPLQAISDSDGERFAIGVMPEKLMPSMSLENQQRLGESYGSIVEIFNFDRNKKFNVETLTNWNDRLDGVIAHRKLLHISDASIQSFFLKGIEVMKSHFAPLDKAQQTEPQEITLFFDIVTKMRQLGVVTLDEADFILNIRKFHLFTIGEERRLKTEVISATSGFYEFIATSAEILQLIKFSFLHGHDAPPFTSERYRAEVVPILVGKVLDGSVLAHDPSFTRFLARLTEPQKALVGEYLKENPLPEVLMFVDAIPSMEIKNMLAVLKEEINTLLPLTSLKKVNEHYGPIPEDDPSYKRMPLVSQPYSGSHNPSRGSQHGTDLEIINYSIQMHLHEGLKEDIIFKEIEGYKKLAKEELEDGKGQKLEDTEGYALFVKLCSGDKRYQFLELTAEDIRQITESVNKDPSLQMMLITKYVLPQITTFAEELNSSGQLYAMLFSRVKGFSGTLWNAESYPRMFYQLFKSDTMASTLFTLWENSPQKVSTIKASEDVAGGEAAKAKKLVEEIYGRKDAAKGSFADAGGLFREIGDNRLVAQEILSHQPESVRGITYYDSKDNLMVLLRNKSEGIPIGQCQLRKEEMMAYWDQQHTTGSDIRLGATAKASVTIGQDTMMRDLLQAAWRMRGLQTGQTVDFVVSSEDSAFIKETLQQLTGRKVEDDLTLGDLLTYTTYVEINRKGDDNFRALQAMLKGVLLEEVIGVMADPTIKDKEKIDAVRHTWDLFSETTPANAYEVYGQISQDMPKAEVVEFLVKRMMNRPSFEAFSKLPALSGRATAAVLESRLRSVAANMLDKLPENLRHGTEYGKERSVQTETARSVEQSVSKQKQKETQMQVQIHKMVSESKYTQERHPIGWQAEKLFTSAYYDPRPLEELKRLSRESIIAKGLPHVVSIKEVLASYPLTHDYADVFDEDFLSTLNFMPVHLQDSSEQVVYHPFGKYHDVVYDVVVIEHAGTAVPQLAIVRQDDADAVEKLLADDAKHPVQGNRDVRVCVYKLVKGQIPVQGSDPIDRSALEANPAFMRKIVQAKFFSGLIAYSPEERKILEEWIKEKGLQRMQKFFEETILNHRDEYHHSDLKRLFDRLNAVEQVA